MNLRGIIQRRSKTKAEGEKGCLETKPKRGGYASQMSENTWNKDTKMLCGLHDKVTPEGMTSGWRRKPPHAEGCRTMWRVGSGKHSFKKLVCGGQNWQDSIRRKIRCMFCEYLLLVWGLWVYFLNHVFWWADVFNLDGVQYILFFPLWLVFSMVSQWNLYLAPRLWW